MGKSDVIAPLDEDKREELSTCTLRRCEKMQRGKRVPKGSVVLPLSCGER